MEFGRKKEKKEKRSERKGTRSAQKRTNLGKKLCWLKEARRDLAQMLVGKVLEGRNHQLESH